MRWRADPQTQFHRRRREPSIHQWLAHDARVLKNLGDELVDLHGPHDHQSLLSPERQLGAARRLCPCRECVGEYRNRVSRLQKLGPNTTALEHGRIRAGTRTRAVTPSGRRNYCRQSRADGRRRNRVALQTRQQQPAFARAGHRHRPAFSEADDSVLGQLAETQRSSVSWKRSTSLFRNFLPRHGTAVVELSEIARSLPPTRETRSRSSATLPHSNNAFPF